MLICRMGAGLAPESNLLSCAKEILGWQPNLASTRASMRLQPLNGSAEHPYLALKIRDYLAGGGKKTQDEAWISIVPRQL